MPVKAACGDNTVYRGAEERMTTQTKRAPFFLVWSANGCDTRCRFADAISGSRAANKDESWSRWRGRDITSPSEDGENVSVPFRYGAGIRHCVRSDKDGRRFTLAPAYTGRSAFAPFCREPTEPPRANAATWGRPESFSTCSSRRATGGHGWTSFAGVASLGGSPG